jgi:hypothetical protein
VGLAWLSYNRRMSKQSISITLSSENLLWLRGRAKASGVRSISEALNQIISNARTGGNDLPHRSIVGTITINESDPDLLKADADIRSLFRRSLNQFPATKRTKRKPPVAKRAVSKGRNRG